MKIQIADTQWDFLPSNAKVIDPDQLDSYTIFIIFLWAVWSVLWLCGSILYIIRLRTGDSNIKMRSPILALLSAFGAEMAFSCTAWDLAVTRDQFPCCLDLYYILIFLPLYFIPFVLRFAKYLVTMSQLKKWQQNETKTSSNIYDHPFVQESFWLSLLGIIMSILLLIANLFQFVLLKDWVNAYGCQLRDYTVIVLAVLFAICLLCFIIGFVLLAKIDDPYHIKKEFISCTVVWICCLLPYLILYKKNDKSGSTSGILASLMFVFIVDGFFTSILWPIMISYKHPPDEVDDGTILSTFEEMILDPECFGIFEEIANIKKFVEVPPFCRDVLKYRKLENKDDLRIESQRIFDTYVKKGSPLQNNFSDVMVTKIETRLNHPTNDLFNDAFQEASKLLKTGNFLNEVKNKEKYQELVERRKKEARDKSQTAQMLAGIH